MRWSRDLSVEQVQWMEKLLKCDWVTGHESGFIKNVLRRGEYGELAQRRLNRLAKHYQYQKTK